ncbi:MAG: amino acid permease [Planctomycetes bacterium]|nr:amino acid permease [Planctomycetota bacterium]
MSESTSGNQASGPGHGQLSLWDTVSIIVGIVIGASIFETPPTIFGNVATPWAGLGVWLFCGVLSFIGALCYAELATTYPRYGGDYVYLSRGFDRCIGFLFGWAQLAVVLSTSTGAMAFVFGKYSAGLLGITDDAERDLFAVQAGVGAVAVLTIMNFFGVVLGKWVQNGLVILKMVGMVLIVLAALWAPASDAFSVGGHTVGPTAPGIPLAIILVLYAYGGWNDAAFVAADLRDRRNITKALLLGTVGITVIYLLVNFAYILSLGFEDATKFRPTIAADVMTKAFGPFGGKLIAILVMASALGAINGLIFTGSRVYLSLGAEHRVFALLGHWNATLKAPIWSLLAQGAVSISMILVVGTDTGRNGINDALEQLGIRNIPWGQYFGGFNTLYAGGAPVFWIFFLLTGFSMFALRARDPHIVRPFELKAPWYPILPIIFCGMCLFGFVSAINYAGWISLLGFIPLFLGLPLYWLSGLGGGQPEVKMTETSYPLADPKPAPDDRFKPRD